MTVAHGRRGCAPRCARPPPTTPLTPPQPPPRPPEVAALCRPAATPQAKPCRRSRNRRTANPRDDSTCFRADRRIPLPRKGSRAAGNRWGGAKIASTQARGVISTEFGPKAAPPGLPSARNGAAQVMPNTTKTAAGDPIPDNPRQPPGPRPDSTALQLLPRTGPEAAQAANQLHGEPRMRPGPRPTLRRPAPKGSRPQRLSCSLGVRRHPPKGVAEADHPREDGPRVAREGWRRPSQCGQPRGAGDGPEIASVEPAPTRSWRRGFGGSDVTIRHF